MGERFGRYELLHLIARGGMGEVFLARAEGAPRPLVLKRVLPHLQRNAGFLDTFLDEARIAAQLNHANVVRIVELGEQDGRWFLAMEHVDGLDLRRLLDRLPARARCVPWPLACLLAAQAAAGLDAAHRARDAVGRPLGVVHRDVSPHNLLLARDGRVALTDFGVARAVGRLGKDEVGALVGKLPYLSPEQVEGEAADARSDQFALGAVLWELLVGRPLFLGRSEPQTLDRVQRAEVPPPSRERPDVPAALDAVVARALARDPELRFPSCADLRDALLDVARLARPPPTLEDVARWAAPLLDAPAPAAPDAAEAAPGAPAPPGGGAPLEPAEEAALAQLAAFDGPFDVDAAEALVDLEGVPGAPAVLDVLQALQQRGLLRTLDQCGAVFLELPPPALAEARARLGALPAEAQQQIRERLAKTRR